jgi:diadenosine tetraphosphate (Ap4A) HIT family hydrolase
MMSHAYPDCPFCAPSRYISENGLAYVIADKFPVNPGHLLIITKRHTAYFFPTTEQERIALFSLLDTAKHYLDGEYAPAGYNVGINAGAAAGQTGPHVHVRLIPRYSGDMDTPRGVIPARPSY